MWIIGAMFPWVRLVTMATFMCLCCDLSTSTDHQHNRIFNGLSGQELADNLAINQLAIIQLLGAQESCDQRRDDLNQLRSDMLTALQHVQHTVQEGQVNAVNTESTINRTLASLEVKLTRLQQQQQDIQDASGNRKSSVTQLQTSLEQRYSNLQRQLEQQRNKLQNNINQLDNLASLQADEDSNAIIAESTINQTLASMEVKLTRLQQDIQEASGSRESSVTQLQTSLEQRYSNLQRQLEQQRNILQNNINQLDNLASLQADEDSNAVITESSINRTLASMEVKLTRLQEQQQASGNRESSVTQLLTSLEQRFSDLQRQLEQQQSTSQNNSNQLDNLASLHTDEGLVFSHDGRQFYLHTEEYMSWDEAQSWCRTHRGSDLAKPSGSIIHFMRKAIKHDIVPDYDAAHGIWLGATDRGQEGQWVWLDGTKFSSTFPWSNDQPNNLRGDQHCLSMVHNKPSPYMADVECSLASHFVCE